MIPFLFLWILYSIAEAYEDSEYTVILDHKPTLYPRLVIGLISVLLFQNPDAYHIASFTLMLMTIFWAVFELAGNIFRGHYFYYIGNISWLDKKLNSYELPVFFVRLWLVALSLCLYYKEEILNTI